MPYAILAIMLAVAILPLDVTQLVFACAGAIGYAVLMYVSGAFEAKSNQIKAPRKGKELHTSSANKERQSKPQAVPRAAEPPPTANARNQFSFAPVKACIEAKPWEVEVAELLDDIMPNRESCNVAEKLARVVKQNISRQFPEAEVTGFASANLSCSRAFGVAVPDVELVLSISPDVALARLQERPNHAGRPASSLAYMDARKLQKAALRVCADRLVSASGFKFRRSAFRGNEPKITLLAPTAIGVTDGNVAIDIYVNAATPFHHTALLAECGSLDSRARELLIIVRCWAKCRGICHAAKGHLSPYLWSLLVIYFLQVADRDEGPILPPLAQFSKTSHLIPSNTGKESASPCQQKAHITGDAPRATSASLFKDFMRFYSRQFDLKTEKISVRLGKSSPVNSGSHTVGPCIEDPFQPEQTLANDMPLAAQERFLEELKRADDLCSRGASLAAILEPWSPPETEAGAGQKDADDDE